MNYDPGRSPGGTLPESEIGFFTQVNNSVGQPRTSQKKLYKEKLGNFSQMKPSRDVYYRLGGGRSPVREKRNFSKKAGAAGKRGSGKVLSEKKRRYGERFRRVDGDFEFENMVFKGKNFI